MKKTWTDQEIVDRSRIFDPHAHVKVNPMKEKPVRANERKQATVPTAGRKLAFGPDNVFNLRRVKQILLDFQNSTVGETNSHVHVSSPLSQSQTQNPYQFQTIGSNPDKIQPLLSTKATTKKTNPMQQQTEKRKRNDSFEIPSGEKKLELDTDHQNSLARVSYKPLHAQSQTSSSKNEVANAVKELEQSEKHSLVHSNSKQTQIFSRTRTVADDGQESLTTIHTLLPKYENEPSLYGIKKRLSQNELNDQNNDRQQQPNDNLLNRNATQKDEITVGTVSRLELLKARTNRPKSKEIRAENAVKITQYGQYLPNKSNLSLTN